MPRPPFAYSLLMSASSSASAVSGSLSFSLCCLLNTSILHSRLMAQAGSRELSLHPSQNNTLASTPNPNHRLFLSTHPPNGNTTILFLPLLSISHLSTQLSPSGSSRHVHPLLFLNSYNTFLACGFPLSTRVMLLHTLFYSPLS